MKRPIILAICVSLVMSLVPGDEEVGAQVPVGFASQTEAADAARAAVKNATDVALQRREFGSLVFYNPGTDRYIFTVPAPGFSGDMGIIPQQTVNSARDQGMVPEEYVHSHNDWGISAPGLSGGDVNFGRTEYVDVTAVETRMDPNIPNPIYSWDEDTGTYSSVTYGRNDAPIICDEAFGDTDCRGVATRVEPPRDDSGDHEEESPRSNSRDTVPDLSSVGIVALLATVIALGTFRRKSAASRAV
jgi:hypothetical protein